MLGAPGPDFPVERCGTFGGATKCDRLSTSELFSGVPERSICTGSGWRSEHTRAPICAPASSGQNDVLGAVMCAPIGTYLESL
jgi:hypothetical protein